MVPRSLCFIKDRDVIDRSCFVPDVLVTVMVNILDKSFDATSRVTFLELVASRLLLIDRVSRESFSQNVYERTIP